MLSEKNACQKTLVRALGNDGLIIEMLQLKGEPKTENGKIDITNVL